ncbi:MAG: response regulator [Myxococcota bacterium]|nr:response regulator [Myxococcota bacterium]
MTPQRTKQLLSVLAVDDDPACLKLLCRHLGDDFNVETADSAENALKILEESTFHVLISDYDLPGKNGAWLFTNARKRAPSMKRILISGQHPDDVERFLRTNLIDAFLAKPISPKQIRKFLAASVGVSRPSAPECE